MKGRIGFSLVMVVLTFGAQSALAQPVARPAWSTGFEEGFPGEFLDWDDGSFSANGSQRSGRTASWAIADASQGAPTFGGEHVYKGWVHASGSSSHRAYPVIHVNIPSPLVNSFMVYLDADYAQLGANWVHFATWGNDADWTVHTMSVRARKLEMAHLDWEWIGPSPQPDFPLKRWVRFTVYIHYRPQGDGTVVVWQDGAPIMRGRYTDTTGQNLMRAHWGMYASGGTSSAVQYNDDIQIWTLSEPLTNFTDEPESPYVEQEPEEPAVNPADAGTASDAGGRPTVVPSDEAGREAPRPTGSSGARAGAGGARPATGGASGSGSARPAPSMMDGGVAAAPTMAGGTAPFLPSQRGPAESSGGCSAVSASHVHAANSAAPLALGLGLLGLRRRRRRAG
jgi:MYXO-CTERM domain-containing protein